MSGSISNLPSILLIDDKDEVLNGLTTELRKLLPASAVEIRRWKPASNADPEEAFRKAIGESTYLVATDYDLTTGVRGLFGLTIVSWCQKLAIPVGDFSRGNLTSLPREPNLFELRVPADDVRGASFIATVFNGFRTIHDSITQELVEAKDGLASLLVMILKRPHLSSQFSLYMPSVNAIDSSLVQMLSDKHSVDDKRRVLTYVLGHILHNSILKYPGPILSENALCSYVATSTTEIPNLRPLFEGAIYSGPFSGSDRYYWHEAVNEILDKLDAKIVRDDFDDFARFNRAALEAKLQRKLAAHSCERSECEGKLGGFSCPFTHRAVCSREDCSVPTSSWIPQGAHLCRVERTFYDEWAPLLGL